MTVEEVVSALRYHVRMNGYAEEADLCDKIVYSFPLDSEALTTPIRDILEQVPCDDIHVVNFTISNSTRESRLFYFNHRTKPLPLRT